MITIRHEGRRYYLDGAPYAARERLRAAGCRWDPDARAWWTGRRDLAESLVAELGEAPAEAGPERLAEDAREVIGRGTYQGRSCYVLGRVVQRGRTAYDRDEIAPVKSRDGGKVKLASRDGSRVWWAPVDEVSVDKRYQRLTSIRSLREYAERARAAGGYVPRYGVDFCGYPCPVDGHVCTADAPCHDCQ